MAGSPRPLRPWAGSFTARSFQSPLLFGDTLLGESVLPDKGNDPLPVL